MDRKLDGGRDGIYRSNQSVFRPNQPWTEYVHDYLLYLHECGFKKVPYPINKNRDGVEEVSYIEGTVYNGTLPKAAQSDELLVSFSGFIRAFHDIGETYIKNLSGNESWMLSSGGAQETMCHGDLGPYNVVVDKSQVIGLIDFDTLHPGSRLWDIAYALYRWIPLMSPENPENFGKEEDKLRRLRIFMTTYGENDWTMEEVISEVVKRLNDLLKFMTSQAELGNENFKRNIEEGHLKQYEDDLEYIKENWISAFTNTEGDCKCRA